MKILCVTHDYPPIVGGAAKVAGALNREYLKAGHEVHLLMGSLNDEVSEGPDKDGIIRHTVPTRKNTLKFGFSIFEMLAFVIAVRRLGKGIVRDIKPDVIHVHYTVPCAWAVLPIARRLNIPIVITSHGGDIPGHKQQLHYKVILFPLRFLLRHIWRRSAAVVAVSRGLADLIRLHSKGIRIRSIDNGIDLDEIDSILNDPPENEENGEASDKVRLLFVSKLVERKGMQFLLPALAELSKDTSVPPFTLDIAGTGEKEEEWRRMVTNLGLVNSVRFLGFLQPEETYRKMQAADVFILPSLSEGMPIVLLEAMACGMPSLVTDIRGNRELVTDGEEGFVVPPGNPAAIIGPLKRLIRDADTRAGMSMAARERAEQFRWDRIAGEYIDLFKSIINRNIRDS